MNADAINAFWKGFRQAYVDAFNAAIYIAICGSWVLGAVLAKGFWSTLFAVLLPPWGWYLIVEWMIR